MKLCCSACQHHCTLVFPFCRFILLEADTTLTPWSKICISQADCILLVASEGATPQVTVMCLCCSVLQAQLLILLVMLPFPSISMQFASTVANPRIAAEL